jgi:hypothetical protein
MLTHPYFLDLLSNFKKSKEDPISKDLLTLLVHNKYNIDSTFLCDILYKHKKSKLKKKEILKNITECLDRWFTLENNYYKILSTDDLSKETISLINKNKLSSKKDLISILYQDIDSTENINYEMLIKLVYKIIDILKSSDINLKKFLVNIENKLSGTTRLNKDNVSGDSSLLNFVTKREKLNTKRLNKDNVSGDSSLLNFVTKREKLNISNVSKFNPIVYDRSVYVYRLNNPCYESIRRRKDLINPKKKIFIKFSDEYRPPLYKIPDYQVYTRNSLKKLINIDYDEDSTWDDDCEGEDIGSDESEEEEISGDEEWIDSDSYDEETTKNIKRPLLIFPKIKCTRNEEFRTWWENLTIEKSETVSEELIKEIEKFKGKENSTKYLSNLFMIKESIIKEYL